jgi:hypothetical protein
VYYTCNTPTHERPIDAEVTVSESRQPNPADPLASQRTELLGRVVAAEFDLERAIAELNRKFIPTPSASVDQLRILGNLQRQIDTAGAAGIAALRADVLATIAATQAAIQESHAAVADAVAADGLGLSGYSAAARQQVLATMAAVDRFNVRFDSAADETEYHRREAERRAYIDLQLAKGTPEGNLDASAGAVGQMVDAHAHGAGDSPEFQQRWNALVATTGRVRDEVRRSGGSTAEFDTRLREDLRRTLKAKGLSDAQIDAQFAAHPDPLDAAKAFVASDNDIAAVQRSAERAGKTTAAETDDELDATSALVASFQSSGIAGGVEHEGPPAHGVAATAAPGASQGR